MSKHIVKTKVKSTKGIDSFFAKKPDVISHLSDSKVIDIDGKDESKDSCSSKVKIHNPLVEEFYKSLTPNEKIAHDLATKMLGTSYDVMRTHGFIQWLKSKKD